MNERLRRDVPCAQSVNIRDAVSGSYERLRCDVPCQGRVITWLAYEMPSQGRVMSGGVLYRVRAVW